MARYHFHIHDGAGFVEDEEGRELPDLEAARREGLRGIRSIVSEDLMNGVLDLRGRLEVVDDAGHRVLTIPFAEAVDIRG
jgi:hypothetical protein